MIVDWDVHHGNGTQALFWNDDRVCYVSTHQDRLYPGTGAVDEIGGPDARGRTVNIPLPAGATGDVFARALEEVVAPVASRFAPTWLLVSAGFDAHRDDPLADLGLSSGDFARHRLDRARVRSGVRAGSRSFSKAATTSKRSGIRLRHRWVPWSGRTATVSRSPTADRAPKQSSGRALVHVEPQGHDLW